MKPHVVIACPSLAQAGAVASVALHHARQLCSSFRVTVISQSVPELEAAVGFARVHPIDFSFLRRFAHVPNEIAFAWEVGTALQDLHARAPVAMVMCHGHVTAAWAARRFKKEFGIPYALVTHGDIFDRPPGTYDARLTYLYRKATPLAYRDADLVVALSPHMASIAARSGVGSGAIALIPNGIDPGDIGLDAMPGPSVRERAGPIELLYVGRLASEKGVDVLIEAAAQLRAGGALFHLRIAGSGPQAQRLRNDVSRLKLEAQVAFMGAVTRCELGALYRSADILCVPSHSDPLPTVILEGMCAGIPIVGSDAGGIPFLLQDGKAGLICTAGDARALARAILALIEDAARARQIAARAQAFALADFSWVQIGAKLANAIENRLGRTSMMAE
jgi:glycosyltransferase involved in cell wall biosynthesis